MDNNTISRTNYFDGQFLRTQDFSDEQGYHIGMRRRLNIANHTWGIVRGLEICWDTVGLQFVIRPGIAIDGYGRELILPESRTIPTKIFDDRGSDLLDVYLVYGLLESDPAPKGYAGCLPDGAPASGTNYRTQEQATIRIEIGELDVLDRRTQPKDVPPTDWNFDATRNPPDNPLQDWLVFLGQIQRNLADTKQRYMADLSSRPYAGLVGATIHSPLQHARIQLGTLNHDDKRGFGVFLADLDVKGDFDPKNPLTKPQFDIEVDGAMHIQGNTTINGEVQINGGSAEFIAGTKPKGKRPWQIYHHQEFDDKNNFVPPEELRIELPEGKDQQLVIGSWSTQKSQFVPCLTITNDCKVTINGTLKVDTITNKRNEPLSEYNKNLSAEAQQMALGSYMSGISGGTALLEKVYQRLVDTGVVAHTASVQANVSSELETLEAVQPETTMPSTLPHSAVSPEGILPIQEIINEDAKVFAQKLVDEDPEKARQIRDALTKSLPPKKRNT